MPRLRISRSALVELIIVTVGVMIALSVDTVREWRANARLASEARANLLSEIRENKTQLDSVLATMKENQQDYVNAHTGAENLLAGRPFGFTTINLGNRLASLSRAAYQTAEITGAFAHMDYQEVRRFAGLYDVQDKYVRIEDEATAIVAVLTPPIVLSDGPDALSRPEIEDWKRGLERAVGYHTVKSQIGNLLSQSYAAALKTAESGE